jgi:hypothetical protein
MMGVLGLEADPEGWQHAGYTIAAVVNQLAEELHAADVRGGSGLRPSWSGPVSEAYLELWTRRHGRYGDLIYQAGRAATAIIGFGEHLADLMYRASELERYWLGVGLHLAADGVSFMLPIGHENLAHEAQAMLHGCLTQSDNDIKAMWADVKAAVDDVVTVLESVLNALADFYALELGVLGTGTSWAFEGAAWEVKHALHDDLLGTGSEILKHEGKAFEVRADHNLKVANLLADKWAEDGDHDARIVGESLVRDAGTDVKVAGDFKGFAKACADHLTYVQIGIAGVGTLLDARKVGLANAIEDNSRGWAELAAGAAASAGIDALLGTAAAAGVVAAAPVLVTIGAVVVTGVVAVGVGDVVQHEVNKHRAGTTRVLTDIGHGVEDASMWGATETGLIPGSAS